MADLAIEDTFLRMREAAEKATPGPWYQTCSPWFLRGDGVVAGSPDGNIAPYIVDCNSYGTREEYEGPMPLAPAEDDAAHIAASNPANVLALLDALDEAQRERDEARQMCERILFDLNGERTLTSMSQRQYRHRKAEVLALTALLEKAKDGLAPLASAAVKFDSHGEAKALSDQASFAGIFTRADIRKARAVFAEIEDALEKHG